MSEVATSSAGSSTSNTNQGTTNVPSPTTVKETLKSTGGDKNASDASYSVGERGGNYNGEPPESAADRAIARKAAKDAEEKKSAKKTPERGKVKSLADLKKLNSKNVAPSELKTNSVELDEEALPEPKLETGRPEPKVKSRTKAAPASVEESIGEGEPTEESLTQGMEAIEEVLDPNVDQTTTEVTDPVDPNAYKPNFKYKAYGEEKEIPEMFRALIKDADSEKAVHEVFTKVDAFEKTKARLDQQEMAIRQQILPELNRYRGLQQEFQELISSEDVFGVMKKFGVDERKVLQAAADRVNLLEASPEVRAMHEARVKAEELQRQSARRLATLEQQAAESNRLAKKMAFENTLARSDVANVAKSFDDRMGTPGTFARMVAQHAHQVYLNSMELAQTGRGSLIDLTPEQAVQDFMQAYGLKLADSGEQRPTQTTAPSPKPQATTTVATPSPKPKIIPNITSKTTSSPAARPVFKNADDIRAFAKQRSGR